MISRFRTRCPRARGLTLAAALAADHALWQEWLVAERTLDEARDQLRSVEHLELGTEPDTAQWVHESAP